MNLFSKERQDEEMAKLQKINCQFQAERGFVQTGLHLTEQFSGYLKHENRILKETDEGYADYVYKNENVYGVELDEKYVIVYRVKEVNDIYTAYGKKVYFNTDYKELDLDVELESIKGRMTADLASKRNYCYLQSTVLGGLMMHNEKINTDYFEALFRTFMTIATEETFIPDTDTINNLLLDVREALETKHQPVVDNLLTTLKSI